MQRFSSMTDDEKIYRWLKVLTNFTEYITYETPNSNESNTPTNTKQQNELKEYIDHNLTWPDSTFNQQKTHEVSKNVHEITQKAHQFLANNVATHEVTKEEIIEYLGNHNYPYYRRLWSLCNIDERLMLYQLATGNFSNPNNRGVIRSLYSRGYIVRKPFFKIPDECFKRFVLSAESVKTFHQWEKEASHSLWANIKAPLFVILVLLAGLFIYISTDALESTLALLTPLLALIPLFFRSFNRIQAAGTQEAITPPEDSESD
jgi:hypothetical protein